MTDRELLELAAKPAGIDPESPFSNDRQGIWIKDSSHRMLGYYWNPLTDDGEALRLAVKLNISLAVSAPYSYAGVCFQESEKACEKHKDSDPYVATRRAIVRAAAEIGKELK